MDEKLGIEEIAAFLETASGFAKRSVAPMLATEHPDGDMSMLPGILDQAGEAGLLASAREGAPGREAGIWGGQSLSQGPWVSGMLLEELALGCGGVAMCFHAQGMGVLPLLRAENPPADPPERMAFAFSESFGIPSLATLRAPERALPGAVETMARDTEGGFEVSGQKSFIYGVPGVEAYLVFARTEKGGWGCFFVPADSSGLFVEDAGARTGLRACGLYHLKLEGVKVDQDHLLRFSSPTSEVVLDQLRFNLIGLSAIATGIARGALGSAREYAAERYQGGNRIIEHPAMRMLLADSDVRVAACRASLAQAAQSESGAEPGFIEAVRSKLFIMQAAAQAVTDCLQIFGGYGYMEDYRMEKRLRDVSVLKSAGGAARELRNILAEKLSEGL
jgi:alkylation response protein AidB-like acyl-CoA dehydrogenase